MKKLFFILGLIALPMVTMAMSSHKAMQAETTGQYIDNSVITLKVKSALLTNPDVKGLNISVSSTKSGQVKLDGTVKTLAQKLEAGRLAKRVEGVTSVNNNIKVRMHN